MSTAAGGVLLLVGGAPTGTHHAALLSAAFAHSHTTQRGMREAALIEGKLEVRLWLPRCVAGADAKVCVELVGLDQLARVHLPIGIPRGLELAKSSHQLGTEHLGQQLGAGLSVAVLSGKRSAIAHDEVGSFFHELAK